MAETASDYNHGDQDPSAQVSTYRMFGSLTKWVALHLAVIILMLSLWFCVGASFFEGLIPGLIIFGLGVYFLRSKPDGGH